MYLPKLKRFERGFYILQCTCTKYNVTKGCVFKPTNILLGPYIKKMHKGALTIPMVFNKNKRYSIIPFFTVKLPFMAVTSIFDIKRFKDVKFWVEQVLH